MSDTHTSGIGCGGLIGLYTVAAVILKLVGIEPFVGWTWWQVFIPFVVFSTAMVALVLVIMLFVFLIHRFGNG